METATTTTTVAQNFGSDLEETGDRARETTEIRRGRATAVVFGEYLANDNLLCESETFGREFTVGRCWLLVPRRGRRIRVGMGLCKI